jgi:hypothetical protein
MARIEPVGARFSGRIVPIIENRCSYGETCPLTKSVAFEARKKARVPGDPHLYDSTRSAIADYSSVLCALNPVCSDCARKIQINAWKVV